MTTQSYINGESVASEATFLNIDPSNGESLGAIAAGGRREVDLAVSAARAAQSSWRRTPTVRRADLIDAYATLIRQHIDELSVLESQDTGKPISQARNDVNVCARYFQFYARAIESFYGQEIPLSADFHAFTTREPYGVIGHVLAWNYPMQLFARAVAPAIATGNTVVLKPADETPRTAVRLAELAIAAGLPSGVINVVTGRGPAAGSALAEHPGIDQVGFVGSAGVGISIATATAMRLAPAVLELGGKSPNIVFADANLDEAVPTIIKSILQNAGQTCSAGSRLLVDHSIKEEVLERVARGLSAARVGRGMDDPDLGPLISQKQLERVRAYVANAGGRTIVGGGSPDLGGGAFFSPTLIDNVDPTSAIAQEEVFGPVIVSMGFANEQEAVDLANATEYGLIAAVWTNDLSRAHRVSREIVAGQVFVNNFGAGGGVELPFGGFKQSGYGREKGLEAMHSCTQTKTTIFKISSSDEGS